MMRTRAAILTAWLSPWQCVFVALIAAGAILAATAAWIPAKAVLAQVLLEHAFSQSQATETSQKPWPWADMTPIARLGVPRLGEQVIVLSGASGQAMAFGPTQVPTGAESGTTVLAAHRDTHFAFVQDLRIGDIVAYDHLEHGRSVYRITHMQTVRWDDFAIPAQAPGEWLILSTCYPLDAATQGPLRRVVWAQRSGPLRHNAQDRRRTSSKVLRASISPLLQTDTS